VNALTLTSPTAALVPTSMSDAMQLATMMADSRLVPQHLQGKPADCLMVVMQAARWRMDPFAVAQATSVPSGKLMYEGKLVAAAVHTSGILSGRLSFDYTGEGDRRTVTVHGILRGEDTARSVSVVLRDAKTNNQHWAKSPDQMLAYHAARVWARRHAPEVMLGVYAPEEFDEDRPLTPSEEARARGIGRVVGLAVPDQPALAAPAPVVLSPGIQNRVDAFKDQIGGILERGDAEEWKAWLAQDGTKKALEWLASPPDVTMRKMRDPEDARRQVAEAHRLVRAEIDAAWATLYPETRDDAGEDEPEDAAP
jgi:hypothetical protein